MRYTIHRLPAVTAASADARSTVYARIKQGLWTPPIKWGPRASGWPAHEVDALIRARIAGKTDDEMRALVKDLIAARRADSEGAR